MGGASQTGARSERHLDSAPRPDRTGETDPAGAQIALQVAEGKTNKEVAAALFLSTKTIEFHLTRVYRKLELHSRGELVLNVAT